MMESQLKQIALSEQQQQKNIAMWEDKAKLAEIRNIYAKNATDTEFAMLVGIGKATGLNPFLREIWLVKYGNSAAQIFIGRDGYRIAAQRQPDYDYHIVDAVYSNDKFALVDGEIRHQYEVIDRGHMLGAYCYVKKRSSSKAMYVFVEAGEYDLKQGLWKTKPATMLKKVAEAQAIRMAFQSTFAGTYAEEELPANKSRPPEAQEKPKALTDDNVMDVEPMIDSQQVTIIDDLIIAHDISFERIEKGLNSYYRKSSIADLTHAEADKFITQLRKIVQHEQSKKNVLTVEAQTIEQEAEVC